MNRGDLSPSTPHLEVCDVGGTVSHVIRALDHVIREFGHVITSMNSLALRACIHLYVCEESLLQSQAVERLFAVHM